MKNQRLCLFRVCALFPLASALLLGSNSDAPAQILNGSFETPGGNRQLAENWTLFGEAYRANYGPPKKDGSWGVIVSGLLPGSGVSSGVSQSLPASTGEQWTFSGFVYNDEFNAAALNQGDVVFLRLDFTGSYGTVSTESPHLDYLMPINNWISLSAGGTAPEGTTGVTFSAILFQEEVRPGGNAWLDDFSVSVQVPEPAAASLLLFGTGLGWALRRRTG
jgi:hypothetical protein